MQKFRAGFFLLLVLSVGGAWASPGGDLVGDGGRAETEVGAPAGTATIVRGPYLQTGSTQGIVVRWRTDVPTDSRVLYGPEPGSLTSSTTSPELVTEHVVVLSGLTPGTRYHYAVGSTSQVLAGDDADHFFRTPPPAGSPEATRVWILGDSGTADANAAAVRDAYYALTGATHTDLWLMLGDNAYPNGTDAEYQAAVFDMYPDMLRKSVLWPTKGNHDEADSPTQTGAYYDAFTMPANGEAGGLSSGTEAYYSFDWANVHFVSLDSHDTSRQPGSAMLTWLDLDLQSTTQDWVVAYWHHPPYSKGTHDSDNPIKFEQVQMRENVLPILEDHGVDLVLSGHSHSYERSFLLDGTYGTPTPDFATLDAAGNIVNSGDGRTDGQGAYEKATLGPTAHEGAVYVVAGSSGKLTAGTLDHPVMFTSLYELGSVVLDIRGNILTASFLNDSGLVADHFTIVKAPGTPYCGNGVIEAGEDCDADDVGGLTCDASCTGGNLTCSSSCTFDYTTCVDCCDGDSFCEPGEDCTSCPTDCFTADGAVCGNGICEAGNGEDCLSCPTDCRGKQNGKPANRFCCGDGDGQNPVSCADPICVTDGYACTDAATPPSCCGDGACSGVEDFLNCALDCTGPVCGDGVCEPGESGICTADCGAAGAACGDGTCGDGEDACSCTLDCGIPPATEDPGATCGDHRDNDCDGLSDCYDADCLVGLSPPGAACTSDEDCCSNKCRGPSGNKTCR